MADLILSEFEKRYKGNPRDTLAICYEIAKELGLDPEKLADYVYINRYEIDEPDNPDP